MPKIREQLENLSKIQEETENVESSDDDVDLEEKIIIEKPSRKTESKNIENSNVKVCKSCGSTENFFRTKRHVTCINCCIKATEEGKPRYLGTEKQKQNVLRAREAKKIRDDYRKQIEQELREEAKKKYEDLLVNKAVSIKKKQIIKKIELDDEISDDETPLEEVVKIKKSKTQEKKPRAKKQPKKQVDYDEDDQPPPPPQPPIRQQTRYFIVG